MRSIKERGEEEGDDGAKGLLQGKEDRRGREGGRWGRTVGGVRTTDEEELICMLVTVYCLFDLEGVLSAGWWDAAEGKNKVCVCSCECVCGRGLRGLGVRCWMQHFAH